MAPHGNHGKEISEDVHQIIVNMHKRKHSYKQISEQVNMSRNTVAKFVQRYKRAGTVKNAVLHERLKMFFERTM